MIEQLMNEYGYRESGTDDLLMPHVLTDTNSVGYGRGVESLTEGSWPFDQPSAPNGSTPMATLDTQSYFPEPEPEKPSKYMYFEAAQANSTVALKSMLYTAPNMEYSIDEGDTWQEWPHITSVVSYDSGSTTLHIFDTITLHKVGDKVYLRGVNPDGFTGEGYLDDKGVSFFSMTGSLYCHGNAQSLIDGDNPTLVAKPMPRFYERVLCPDQASVLLSAPELPATTLVGYSYIGCYENMFLNCTSLTQAPELPATTLANQCYDQMFSGCTSLAQAPKRLPATTLADYCCYNMFAGCTSLTEAPELPATTLARSCYHEMFYGCTSLTQAPELPATTLAHSCYYSMFAGCTSLTQAPERLPATTLDENCYRYMFGNCTSLTEAPVLPAKTLVGVDIGMYQTTGCYQSMFYGCTSLNSITCLATDISADGCTSYWLYDVSPTGTFTKAASMSGWTTGPSGIPSGWTIQDYSE